jgi:pyroglutamyl-peptidase
MAASPSSLGEQVPDCSTSILPLGSLNSSENILQTTVDMEKLLVPTAAVEISHDCGKFVCEG